MNFWKYYGNTIIALLNEQLLPGYAFMMILYARE